MTEHSTTDPQTGLDKFFTALRRIDIRRRTDDKWIGGVCSGLADRLGVDPVIIRVAVVVLSFFWGFGIVAYLLAWVLLVNDKQEIVAERALRDGDGGSIVLLLFAAFALFGGLTFGSNGRGAFPFLLVPFIVFAVWVAHPRMRGKGWSGRSQNRPDADQRVGSYQAGTAFPAGGSPTTASSSPTTSSSSPTTFGSAPTTVLPAPSTYGPVPATRPVAPRKPRRRSGGPLMALLAIGLALATYGSLIWAGGVLSWTGDHQAIAMAGSLAAVGLLLVGLGLAGWRAGFVAFLAIVLAIVTLLSTVVPPGIHVGGRVGDAIWAPTSVTTEASTRDYRLGVGDGVLDLSKLSVGGVGQSPVATSVPAYVGLGDLKVVVPAGLNVRFVGHVGLGEIVLPGQTEGNGQGGSDLSRSLVIGDAPPDVIVNAGVGVGTLTLVKE